jgi:hypothetical protein
MIEEIRRRLRECRELIEHHNASLSRHAGRYTIEQAKLVYDAIKNLEVLRLELETQLRLAETLALAEALNPPDPLNPVRTKMEVN